MAEVTTNNTLREVRAATKAQEMKNITEKKKGSGCVSVLFELNLGVEHFVQQNIQIILQLDKVAAGY